MLLGELEGRSGGDPLTILSRVAGESLGYLLVGWSTLEAEKFAEVAQEDVFREDRPGGGETGEQIMHCPVTHQRALHGVDRHRVTLCSSLEPIILPGF